MGAGEGVDEIPFEETMAAADYEADRWQELLARLAR